jgi:hypothetical protein
MSGFSSLHERGWFKSLAALVAFMVGLVALITAATNWTEPVTPVTEISKPAEVQPQKQRSSPEARVLDEAAKQKLIGDLDNPDARISIICQRNDPEAARYARAIEDFLEMRHYSVGLAFAGLPASFKGLDIEKQGNRVFIRVGRNPG